MPRYVLLFHECPAGYVRPSHWDLMFEFDGVLRTWALFQLPRDWRSICRKSGADQVADTNTVSAEALADHRIAYFDFEGELGGGRGHVLRAASGAFEIESESPDQWSVLAGGDLQGTLRLQRVAGERSWTLSYEPTI